MHEEATAAECALEDLMSDKQKALETFALKGQEERPVDSYAVMARTTGSGQDARNAQDGHVRGAARARHVRMITGKVGYYVDFMVYATLMAVLVVSTLPKSRSDQLTWLIAGIAGAGSWTLIEYFLHRFVLHGVPLVAGFHQAHHEVPRAYLSTPTWISLSVLVTVFFVPIWRLLSLNVAFGAIIGLITGWLWYGIVHHVIHHRRPRKLAAALRWASHRHRLHHSPLQSGNYGVTTAFWDHLFGTHISFQARAATIAGKRAE
jgi:sterol desaturase/sphingolipid hydroxylase (fatty acid hydroxylase superfamily)